MIRRPPRSTLFPLHDALPISSPTGSACSTARSNRVLTSTSSWLRRRVRATSSAANMRSEEHTSELQSPCNLVCRLLLEKKKKKKIMHRSVNGHEHIYV